MSNTSLPRGYLSPSQIAKLQRCAKAYELEYLQGFQPPDEMKLLIGRQTHNTILEYGLGSKLVNKVNRTTQELAEYHKASLQTQKADIEQARLRTQPTDQAIEREAEYIQKIVSTNGVQKLLGLSPVAIEKTVFTEIGGVPVQCRIDLIAKVDGGDTILDLKRVGKKPSPDQAKVSTQLTTEAIGTGIDSVGLVSIVTTDEPYVVNDDGIITASQKERVEAIYFGAAKAISSGVFPPVDRSNKMTGWVCQYQYCPFWSRHAKDKNTGRDMSCEFGERSG